MDNHYVNFQGTRKQCVECGKAIFESEALIYENKSICSACKPIFIQKLREGIFNEKSDLNLEKIKFAGFWIRAGAKIIDIVIVYFLCIVATATMLGVAYILDVFFNIFWHSQYEASILLFSLFFIYNVLLIGSYGATLGKKIFKIRVVSTDGTKAVYSAVLKRQIAEILSAAVFLSGYIAVVFDKQKRALHDYYGNTWVIKL
ncbi:MAG: RDD family protein [Desulfobacteraceae bacterium]|nr:MAG: RDD family protein [Desulfobacteraceae bacterium]